MYSWVDNFSFIRHSCFFCWSVMYKNSNQITFRCNQTRKNFLSVIKTFRKSSKTHVVVSRVSDSYLRGPQESKNVGHQAIFWIFFAYFSQFSSRVRVVWGRFFGGNKTPSMCSKARVNHGKWTTTFPWEVKKSTFLDVGVVAPPQRHFTVMCRTSPIFLLM